MNNDRYFTLTLLTGFTFTFTPFYTLFSTLILFTRRSKFSSSHLTLYNRSHTLFIELVNKINYIIIYLSITSIPIRNIVFYFITTINYTFFYFLEILCFKPLFNQIRLIIFSIRQFIPINITHILMIFDLLNVHSLFLVVIHQLQNE